MEKLVNKFNLDINLLLINWGLMSGPLHDGVVEPTKFGRFNQWFTLFLSLFTGIKWSILSFFPKHSKMANWLDDWGYFYGPKIIIDFIIIFSEIYIIVIMFIFYLASRNTRKQKMLNWLYAMEYDQFSKSFKKLNLTKTESKMFIKRLSLSIFLLKSFTHPFLMFFIIISFVFVFIFQNDYQLNYIISFLCFVLQLYYNIQFIFGFLVILYPVS